MIKEEVDIIKAADDAIKEVNEMDEIVKEPTPIKTLDEFSSVKLTCICGDPMKTKIVNGVKRNLTITVGKICMPFCGDSFCEDTYKKIYYKKKSKGKSFPYYEVLLKRHLKSRQHSLWDDDKFGRNDDGSLTWKTEGSSIIGFCNKVEEEAYRDMVHHLKSECATNLKWCIEGPPGEYAYDGPLLREFERLVLNKTTFSEVDKIIPFLLKVVIHQGNTGLTWLCHLLDHEARRISGDLGDCEI